MSETAPQMTRAEITALIAEKAWKDEAFHRAVLEDANKAYEQYVGQPVPNGLTLKVIEDTPNQVHFVLPAKPADAGELSDAELENVAGGVFFTATVGPLASVATLAATRIAQSAGW